MLNSILQPVLLYGNFPMRYCGKTKFFPAFLLVYISPKKSPSKKRIADSNSATSKTPISTVNSKKIFWVKKKGKSIALPFFEAGKKISQFPRSEYRMGVFEVAEFKSASGSSLRRFPSEISRKNHGLWLSLIHISEPTRPY